VYYVKRRTDTANFIRAKKQESHSICKPKVEMSDASGTNTSSAESLDMIILGGVAIKGTRKLV